MKIHNLWRNRCKLFTLLAALLCATTVLGQTDNYPFDLPGSGTIDNPYLIESEEHWNQLWRKVGNEQRPYADKYFKLTNDISVNRPLGLQENRMAFFSGHFDGDGHTLTVQITKANVGFANPSNPHLAPFRCMRNGSIKNLHVTGTVDSPWEYAAGLIGLCCGNTVIENCRVSVKVTSTFQGDGKHGGLVAVHQKYRSTDDRLTIRGCVFDGMLIATESTGSCGFLGYDNMLEKGAIIEDCIFAPTEVSTQGGNTFFDARPEAHPTLSNCYYTQPLGNVQGKAMHSITSGSNTTVEKGGAPTASYGVSGITVYGENAGLKYLDGCYGGSNDAVALNLGGSDAGVYMTTTGAISGIKNPYTLTMEDADAVVTSMSFGDDVYYIERSWDEDSKTVVESFRTLATGQYTELTGNSNEDIDLAPGYYVVKGNVDYYKIRMIGNGEHHLVLCDGATLKMLHIDVVDENSLYIYGQINDTGKLTNQNKTTILATYHAGIGGSCGLNEYIGKSNGPIIIHGGNINVAGQSSAAGIGGGQFGDGGIVTIYGGSIRAIGGGGTNSKNNPGTAGIGGGDVANGGTVTIYGGHVYAQAGGEGGGAGIGGGKHRPGGTITICGGYVEAHGNVEHTTLKTQGGAGLGGGSDSAGGTINISGGQVYAYGDNDAAGIGGGENGNGGTVTISGGYVKAQGGENGAGIGSGCEDLTDSGRHGGSLTVTGGEVYAYGGIDAAGIGGGEDADGATVTITGGYVYAEGNDGGAGIGGGEEGDGGKVTITGGTVEAKAGKQEGPDKGYRAIGAGHGSDNNGSLTLGNDRLVMPFIGGTTQGYYPSGQRINGCQRFPAVMIQSCHHPGANGTVFDGSSHHIDCTRCKMTIAQHTFGDNGQCSVCKLIRLEDEGDYSAVLSAWSDGNPHRFVVGDYKLAAAKDDEGNWTNRAYTVCLPFDMDLIPYANNLSLYSLNYIKDGKEMIFIENEPYIKAGMPYLLVIHQGELELLSADVTLISTPDKGHRVYDWETKEKELGWWTGTFTKLENAEAAAVMAYALQQATGDFRRITTDTPEASLGAFRAMYYPDELPTTDVMTIQKGILIPDDEMDDVLTVTVTEPNTLAKALGLTIGTSQDATTGQDYVSTVEGDYKKIHRLKVVGPISGGDLDVLKYLAGYCPWTMSTNYIGHLEYLDLYDTQIKASDIGVQGNEKATVKAVADNILPIYALQQANKLKTLILPKTCTKIEELALEDCKALEILVIGDDTKELDWPSIYSNSKLTRLYILSNEKFSTEIASLYILSALGIYKFNVVYVRPSLYQEYLNDDLFTSSDQLKELISAGVFDNDETFCTFAAHAAASADELAGVSSVKGWFNSHTDVRDLTPLGYTSIDFLYTADIQQLTQLEKIALPVTLDGMEDNVFSKAPDLRYVDMQRCNATDLIADVKARGFGRLGIDSLQTLVYVPATYGESDGTNIIVGDNTSMSAQAFRLVDGKDYCVPYAFHANNVENSRSLGKSAAPYSICLPYDLPIPAGSKAYKLSGRSTNELIFTETLETLEALQPYLIWTADGDASLNTAAAEIPVSDAMTSGQQDAPGYSLHGTINGISNADAAEMGAYALQQDGLWHPVQSDTDEHRAARILPYRAYLLQSASAGARAIGMTLEGTTGITQLRTIDHDGTVRIYDLNGRLLSAPTKGINIINGKKVIHNK